MRKAAYTLLLLFPLLARGQSPLMDHWFLNNFLVNPSITGIEGYMDIQIGGRYQWVNIEGAPKTYYISAHSPLGNPRPKKGFTRTVGPRRKDEYNYKGFRFKNHHGVGGVIFQDVIGPFQSSETSVTYAYHLALSNSLFLSAGSGIGLFQKSLNSGFISPSVQNDPAISDYISQRALILKPSFWLYNRSFYLGGALTELALNKSLSNTRSLVTTLGYRFDKREKAWHTTPSAIVRLGNTRLNYDLSIKVDWYRKALFGGTYRSTGDIVAFVGFTQSYLFSFNYLYNIPYSQNLTSNSSGTHELVLNFRIKNKEKVPCPQLMW